MTPEEFAARMKRIAERHFGDKELGHIMADELMCKLLISLGYDEGVKVFDEIDKWYA